MERRVAVTGLGVLSCIGNDVTTFWNNLINGVCGIDHITEYPTENLAVKIGGMVRNFNPEEYGMDKPFIRKQDPFTVYAMASAWQAMKDSGLVSGENIEPARLATYVGSGIGGFQTIQREVEKFTEDPSGKWISPNFVPTMISDMAGGQIAIKFNAQGSCIDIVTACATSTHSIGEAYRAIRYGFADAIIAGGSDHCTIPIGIAGFANAKALTRAEDPKYASLPFNRNRGGFVMADGSAIMILEDYEHALARGAHIYAEVVGYGSTCDAYHATAPRPDGSTQAECIRIALEQAGGGRPVTDEVNREQVVVLLAQKGIETGYLTRATRVQDEAALAQKRARLSVAVTRLTLNILGPTEEGKVLLRFHHDVTHDHALVIGRTEHHAPSGKSIASEVTEHAARTACQTSRAIGPLRVAGIDHVVTRLIDEDGARPRADAAIDAQIVIDPRIVKTLLVLNHHDRMLGARLGTRATPAAMPLGELVDDLGRAGVLKAPGVHVGRVRAPLLGWDIIAEATLQRTLHAHLDALNRAEALDDSLLGRLLVLGHCHSCRDGTVRGRDCPLGTSIRVLLGKSTYRIRQRGRQEDDWITLSKPSQSSVQRIGQRPSASSDSLLPDAAKHLCGTRCQRRRAGKDNARTQRLHDHLRGSDVGKVKRGRILQRKGLERSRQRCEIRTAFLGISCLDKVLHTEFNDQAPNCLALPVVSLVEHLRQLPTSPQQARRVEATRPVNQCEGAVHQTIGLVDRLVRNRQSNRARQAQSKKSEYWVRVRDRCRAVLAERLKQGAGES